MYVFSSYLTVNGTSSSSSGASDSGPKQAELSSLTIVPVSAATAVLLVVCLTQPERSNTNYHHSSRCHLAMFVMAFNSK